MADIVELSQIPIEDRPASEEQMEVIGELVAAGVLRPIDLSEARFVEHSAVVNNQI